MRDEWRYWLVAFPVLVVFAVPAFFVWIWYNVWLEEDDRVRMSWEERHNEF